MSCFHVSSRPAESPVGRARRIPALVAAALCALPAVAAACVVPTGNTVFALACTTTSNFIDQGLLQIDPTSGVVQYGFTPLAGTFTITDLAATTPAAGQLGNNTLHGSLVASNNEPVLAHGTGVTAASGTITDIVFGNSTSLSAFANGNPGASVVHLAGESLVPNLHVSSSGNVTGGDAAASLQSGAVAAFQDIISVSSAQFAVLAAARGVASLASVWMRLAYNVSGTATGTPSNLNSDTFGDAFGTFTVSITDLSDPFHNRGDGFNFDTLGGPTVFGTQEEEVFLEIEPDFRYLVSASLSVGGLAVGQPGQSASWNVDYSHSATLVGATFFLDEARTQPLITLDLNSAYGFNYSPITPITPDTGGNGNGDSGSNGGSNGNGGSSNVPEPGPTMLLLAGLAGMHWSRPRRGLPGGFTIPSVRATG